MTASIKDRVLDALERAGSAAAEQFMAVVLTAGGLTGLASLPWVPALSTAAGAALVSLLLTGSLLLAGASVLPFWADTLVRVAKTFVASLLATLGGGVVDVLHVHWTQSLSVAGLAAFLALVKCLLSPNAHLSGSLLPTPTVARLHDVELAASPVLRKPAS